MKSLGKLVNYERPGSAVCWGEAEAVVHAPKKWPQEHGGRSSDEDARGVRKEPRAVDRAVGDKGQAEGRDPWGIVHSGRALRYPLRRGLVGCKSDHGRLKNLEMLGPQCIGHPGRWSGTYSTFCFTKYLMM